MNFFTSLAHKIAAFFGSHHDSIQSGIKLAQSAAASAIAVSTALNEDPSVIRVISGISDGLTKVSAAVTAESMTEHAGNLTALAEGLIDTTNDVGVKSTDAKASIGAALAKVNGVVGALEAAAAAKS
jgi:hypothetical protein